MYIWLVKDGGVSSGVSDPKYKKKKSKMIQNCFFWEAKNLVGAFCTI